MRTKADAETRLQRMPLRTAVAVIDTGEAPQDMASELRPGPGRRAYRFAVPPPGRGIMTIEIDADPSPEQLAALARQLPLAEKDRAAALDEMLELPVTRLKETP